MNFASWAWVSGLKPCAARGPSSRPGWIALRPSFAASGASRCFASGLQRWAPSRSPRLYGVQNWLKSGRPTCGRWTPSLQLRYGALRVFLGTARFCGRCSRLDTAWRPHGGRSTNGCCGWRKHPLPPARCRCWCRQCWRSAPSRH